MKSNEYHTCGTILKSNRIIVETGAKYIKHIYDLLLNFLGFVQAHQLYLAGLYQLINPNSLLVFIAFHFIILINDEKNDRFTVWQRHNTTTVKQDLIAEPYPIMFL
jgi:TM2 domain-containing membrane protein YozV